MTPVITVETRGQMSKKSREQRAALLLGSAVSTHGGQAARQATASAHKPTRMRGVDRKRKRGSFYTERNFSSQTYDALLIF